MTHTQIIQLYKDGTSNKELSHLTGLHRVTVQRILKKNNITLRKTRKSELKLNKSFFSEYNKESCYWAGFILADGNIRKNRNTLQITLKNTDITHLNKFLNCIKCYDYRAKENKKKTIATITISIDEYKLDLNTFFDIGPQKTFTSKISDKIPVDFYPDFIRGIFDGDGCVGYSNCIYINFVCTIQILDKLTKLFYDIGVRLKSKNIIPPIQKRSINNLVGSIHYSGKNSKIILEYLYKDSEDHIRLERKYQKYKINYGE